MFLKNILKSHMGTAQRGRVQETCQFMYGGKLQKVKFKYKGSSVEAVLDRLRQPRYLIRETAYIPYRQRCSARASTCGCGAREIWWK